MYVADERSGGIMQTIIELTEYRVRSIFGLAVSGESERGMA